MILGQLGRLAYFDGYNFLGAISPSGLGSLGDLAPLPSTPSASPPYGQKDWWQGIAAAMDMVGGGVRPNQTEATSAHDAYYTAQNVAAELATIAGEPEAGPLVANWNNLVGQLQAALGIMATNTGYDVWFGTGYSDQRKAALQTAAQQVFTALQSLAGADQQLAAVKQLIAARKQAAFAASQAQTAQAQTITTEAGAVGAQAGEMRLFGIPVTWLAGAGAAVVLIMFLTRKKSA